MLNMAKVEEKTVLRKELERFCQTTSVKGIPRAAKAEHKGLCATWVIAVAMMLTLASYQVSMLIFEFLEYPTYTVTNENIFHPYNDKPQLPTLTICNEKPFSSLQPSATTLGYPTLEEYYALVDQMTTCSSNCDAQTLATMGFLNRIMRTTSSYFQNIGDSNSQMLGHSLENFIVSCNEILFLGLTFVEKQCSDLVNITLSPDVDFYNCYRINLPNDYDMDTHGMVAGVAIVLYLDNINSNNLIGGLQNMSFNAPITKYGAVAVASHKEGTAFPALDGTQLPAGISAKIQLRMGKHKRLEPPYGECENIDVHGYEGLKMCLSDCFQERTRANCNCTDARLIKQMETSHKPFCLKVDYSDPLAVAYNYECATHSLTSQGLLDCLAGCPQACLEFGYEKEISFSKWPSASSMETFYNSFIRGRHYEEYFTVVYDVITGNCSSETECMLKYIIAQKVIEDNFLEVKFHLSDVRYMHTEEKKKIGIADFCSKLGGILNLWAGITVVLVLELIELFGRILLFQFQSSSKTTKVKRINIKPPEEKENSIQRIEDSLENKYPVRF